MLRSRGRHRGRSLWPIWRPAHLDRQDEMIGDPYGLEPQTLGLERGFNPVRRIQLAESNPNVHRFVDSNFQAAHLRSAGADTLSPRRYSMMIMRNPCREAKPCLN